MSKQPRSPRRLNLSWGAARGTGWALAIALNMTLGAAGLAQTTEAKIQPLNLPSLGDADTDALPLAMERRYGEQIMRQLKRQPQHLDDPVLLAYVERLWQPLLASAKARGGLGPDLEEALSWQLFLVQDRSVNAFALPGGYVGVHLGLIAMTRSPDELAAVLSHELTHVTQRHIARGLTQSQRQGNLALATTLLGVLAAAAGGGGQLAQAAIVGGSATALQAQLSFSRDMEREADRVGEGVFRQAGFDPLGIAGMFEELERANRLNDSGAYPYLRTHPLTADRLAEARARLPSMTASSARTPPTLLHGLMVGRARALMNTDSDAQDQALSLARRWLAPGAAPVDAAERFQAAASLSAGAWAAARSGHAERMRACLDALDALGGVSTDRPHQGAVNDPATGDVRAVLALLRLELPMRASSASIQTFDLGAGGGTGAGAEQEAGSRSWHRARLWLRAERLWRQGQPGSEASQVQAWRDTAQALQSHLSTQSGDGLLWDALARIQMGLGQTLSAQRARAEALLAKGDVDAALLQLRQAQTATRTARGTDLIEASVIDARMRQLLALRQRWADDLRSLR